MTGDQIIQIVSLVLTAAVSIITLLVRARIIELEGEVKGLNALLTTANQTITTMSGTIDSMSAQITALTDTPKARVKDEPYTAMPPYKPKP